MGTDRHGPRNIFLVGMMGAGKTTLGRALAQRLQLRVRRHRPGPGRAHRSAHRHHLRDRRRAGLPQARDRGARRARRASRRQRHRNRRRRRARRGEPPGDARARDRRLPARAPGEPLGAHPPRHHPAAARHRPIPAPRWPRSSSSAIRSTAKRPTSSSIPGSRARPRWSPAWSTALRRARSAGSAHVSAHHAARRAWRAQLPDPHRQRASSTQAALFAPHVRGRRAALVTNETVAPLYADAARSARSQRAGTRALRIVLPDGEAYKDWQHSRRHLRGAARGAAPIARRVLVALGGGVVGDMAGLRRRDLPARHRAPAGADDAARPGRLVGGREDRDQPSAGQEHDRRVPPTARR